MSQTNKESTHLKHPFSKEKLKVTDRFESTARTPCIACKSDDAATIALIQSDMKSIRHYAVVSCQKCKNNDWYVFPNKT